MSAPGQVASAEAAEAAEAAQRASRARRLAPAFRQLVGFLAALVLVILLMGAWSWAQDLEQRHPDGRLWGELLFLVLVLWWGTSVLSSLVARVTRAIHPALEVPPITIGQALVWAAATVVAVPMMIQLRWLGVVLPLAVSTACSAAIYFARRRSRRVPNQPLCFSFVVGALALVPLALAAGPIVKDLELAGPADRLTGDATLAADLSPMLFFDTDERFPPVDIERNDPKVCETKVGVNCEPLAEVCKDHYGATCDAAALRDTWDTVRSWSFVKVTGTMLDPGEAAGGPTSSIYYHVFREPGGSRIYVDYWWYFAHNPAPVARSFLCGRALTRGWLGAACAEHPADWEGMTLVLDPAECRAASGSCTTFLNESYRITEAHYGQHEKVVRYRWADLQDRWRRSDLQRHWKQSLGRRPLVFVALDSHASYAEPCEKCEQIAHPEFSEKRDGAVPWRNNRGCRSSCVRPLPLADDGSPGSWNAFQGHWGAQHCILFESYCDSQLAPKAPGFQLRYQEPCEPRDRWGDHCVDGPALKRTRRT